MEVNDIDKVFGLGSFWYFDDINHFCAMRGSDVNNNPNMAFKFSSPKTITKVVVLGFGYGPPRI